MHLKPTEDNQQRKRKARADGEGSLFQRKDGKWVGQITYIGPTGKREIVTRVRKTQGEAREELTKLKGKQDARRLVLTGNKTIGSWLDLWMAEYVEPEKRPKTIISYNQAIKHVPEYIRRLPLRKLPEATEIFDHLFRAVAKEHGGRTAENLRTVLRASFNVAKRKKRIEVNPICDTEPVQYERQPSATFTVEEAKRFIAAAEFDRLGALFIIAVTLGLREAEVSGLKSEDLELDRRVLHVRRTIQHVKLPGDKKGHWEEGPPKTDPSKRALPVTETIYRAVIRHLARRQEEAAKTKNWKDSGYLFVSVTGQPLHPSNLLRAFHAVCDAAKVPRIRLHDTRHTAGTMLHAQGASPFVIQAVLGHSQLSTTKRYTAIPMEVSKAALEKVEAVYNPTPPTKPEQEQGPEVVPAVTAARGRQLLQ
jgi:integrase